MKNSSLKNSDCTPESRLRTKKAGALPFELILAGEFRSILSHLCGLLLYSKQSPSSSNTVHCQAMIELYSGVAGQMMLINLRRNATKLLRT